MLLQLHQVKPKRSKELASVVSCTGHEEMRSWRQGLHWKELSWDFQLQHDMRGMYADISWKAREIKKEIDKEKFKILWILNPVNVKHFRFSSQASQSDFGKQILQWRKIVLLLSGKDLFQEKPYSTLQLVQIYFETATFEDIERDKKIKTEAQLSIIGGTMGLLTEFSIISGVEIIFFLFRLVNFTNFIIGNNPSLGWSAPSGSGGLMLWQQPKRSFRTIWCRQSRRVFRRFAQPDGTFNHWYFLLFWA